MVKPVCLNELILQKELKQWDGIRTYKKFTTEMKFKGRKISKRLTYHHLRHRSEGGDVSIENGQYAPVAVLGTLLVESAGTINAGEPVASDSNGKAVKATGDALVNGYAQDSVTEGQEVRVLRGI